MLVAWLANTAIVFAVAKLLPGFTVKGLGGAVIVAAVFGLLQFFLGKPLFVAVGIGTLGLGFLLASLTRVLVTALLLMLTDKLSDSLKIKSFGTAVVGALAITLMSSLLERIL